MWLSGCANTIRGDLEAARYFLEYLRPIRSFGDPEIQFEISLLEIDLFAKQEDYDIALQHVNKHISTLKRKAGAGKRYPDGMTCPITSLLNTLTNLKTLHNAFTSSS